MLLVYDASGPTYNNHVSENESNLLLTTMFQKKKVKCIRIDGQTPVTTRQTLVADFQNKDDIKAAVVRFYFSASYSILHFS